MASKLYFIVVFSHEQMETLFQIKTHRIAEVNATFMINSINLNETIWNANLNGANTISI